MRTRSRLGSGTMPVKRQAMRATRSGAPPSARSTTALTANASVAVPCRMMPGSPAPAATAASLWIGFQIRAHSV